MADDEYTLLSSKEVSELKQDVDYLKKNPLGGTKSGKSLQESIDKLNDNMETLIEIFKEASDQMKAEERESDVIAKRIQPIEQRLDDLSDQNQKIAKGILAVADMVSAKEQQQQRPRPQQPPQMRPQQQPMQRPAMAAPQQQNTPTSPRLPPLGGMPPQSPSQGMSMPMPPAPPMPPKRDEKKGMFGGLIK